MADTLVLNAAQDIKNVVEKKDLQEITRKTLGDIMSHLLSISGPYARNAFILANAFEAGRLSNSVNIGQTSVKAFTKDGRHTLAQISYASPIQRYIKDNLIAHVGRAVDEKCGDGTTSSMIFAASFLASMLRHRQYFDRISTGALEQIYADVSKAVLDSLQNYVITKEDLFFAATKEDDTPQYTPAEIAAVMAYMQAYTSSGGLDDVSQVIGDVVKNVHPDLWEYAISQRYPYGETKTDFRCKVELDDYEYCAQASLLTIKYLLASRMNYYENDDVDILVMPQGLISTEVNFKTLLAYINNEQERPLVLYIPYESVKDNQALDILNDCADKAGKDVLIIAAMRDMGATYSKFWSMEALAAKADKPQYTSELCQHPIQNFLITHASIHLDGKRFQVKNLVQNTENNIHPGIDDLEHYPYYNGFLTILRSEYARESSLVEKDPYRLKDMKAAITMLCSVRQTRIVVSGSAVDQQYMGLVLDDASGAAVMSLKYGMVFDGPYRLLQATLSAFNNYSSTQREETIANLCTTLMYKVFLQAAMDMTHSGYGPYAKHMHTPIPVLSMNLNKQDYYVINPEFRPNDTGSIFLISSIFDIKNILNVNEPEKTYLTDGTLGVYKQEDFDIVKKLLESENKYGDGQISAHEMPPCQPAVLFDTLLWRVREICLRYATIGSLIAPGTVWDSDMEK